MGRTTGDSTKRLTGLVGAPDHDLGSARPTQGREARSFLTPKAGYIIRLGSAEQNARRQSRKRNAGPSRPDPHTVRTRRANALTTPAWWGNRDTMGGASRRPPAPHEPERTRGPPWWGNRDTTPGPRRTSAHRSRAPPARASLVGKSEHNAPSHPSRAPAAAGPAAEAHCSLARRLRRSPALRALSRGPSS